ncbi:sodium:solute symporter [Aureliella helgolandensis]|uniref:Sodium/glucose cotransporter n=1 Tax=Aureliella helgolandensis TaxID=2527968 RepID=A0A518G7V4_9BACT|nr:sodium:solute symporter [Aureliella helgolandensis]QDV24676.1 Sodium/glucose cotransporter [Aureliella helgolandensis]
MPSSLSPIDFGIIGIYLIGMIAVGALLAKRNTNAKEFTAAGGAMAGWVVGLSIFGTFVSSISFLANPGKAYADNWNPFAFSLSLPLAAYFAAKYFVPFYRRSGHVSAYQHLEERFGSWARFYAGVCYMLTQVARMATIMYLVALALAPLTGWSIHWIIVGTGLMVTAYTLMGGIEAVIWTDAVQSLVLTLGIFIALGLILFQMPAGPMQVFEIAQEQNKFSLGSLSTSLSQSTFWGVLLYGTFINLQNFGIDQSYVQRYITAKSEREAVKSVWLGALLYIPISALLFLVGTGLFSFYTAMPERLPAGLAADEVFPHFIVTEFPIGLKGILIASIFAAAMSSVDSSLNSSATLVFEDWYKRLFRASPTERQAMRVLHTATLVFGLLGTGAALAMIGAASALDVWWKLAGIFSGGMLGLFLLGILTQHRRSTFPPMAALWATLVSVVLIVWLSLSQTELWPAALDDYRNPLHNNWTIVLGTTVLVVGGAMLSSLLSKKPIRSGGE